MWFVFLSFLLCMRPNKLKLLGSYKGPNIQKFTIRMFNMIDLFPKRIKKKHVNTYLHELFNSKYNTCTRAHIWNNTLFKWLKFYRHTYLRTFDMCCVLNVVEMGKIKESGLHYLLGMNIKLNCDIILIILYNSIYII